MRFKKSTNHAIDKDGPIHDVTWSPNSKEFGVVYGYMPAKTTIFNFRGVATQSFPVAPRNTIAFSPHGRFVVVAGFGNLAGQMDVYDLERDYKKITTIEAANATVCEWSPDGKHILTATTSPRLRVDNGIRIWHVGGGLMYNEDMNELYHVTWRPQSTAQHPLTDPFHPLPTPHPSALDYLGKLKTPSKPAGAYRPPGARGQVTPLAFRREDEGGAAHVRESAPGFGVGNVNGFGKPRRREVPGADPATEYVPPGAAPGGGVALPPGAETAVGDDKLSKSAAKNKKKREAKKARESTEKPSGSDDPAAANITATGPTELAPPITSLRGGLKHLSPSPNRRGGHERSHSKGNSRSRAGSTITHHHQKPNGSPAPPGKGNHHHPQHHHHNQQNSGKVNGSDGAIAAAGGTSSAATTTSGSGSTAQDKRVRGLLKKIRAIDELKMRLAAGEKLEDTQMKKIQTEEAVRKELDGLHFEG
jgi:translation initiation factor 2A